MRRKNTNRDEVRLRKTSGDLEKDITVERDESTSTIEKTRPTKCDLLNG